MADLLKLIGASVGPRLFDIPGSPTVRRDPVTGQWEKLAPIIEYAYKQAAADGINYVANRIANKSLSEVPRGPHGDDEEGPIDELAFSIRYPGNDSDSKATANDLWASVSYNSPYALAQEEGLATARHHKIRPITKKGDLEGFYEDIYTAKDIIIEWVVEDYTTPGTKSHYLSDPFKEYIPSVERIVAARVQAVFREQV